MSSKSCFLIENPLDLFYLTGLQLSAGMLFLAPKKNQLFVDGRYFEMVKKWGELPVQLLDEEAQRRFLQSHRIEELIFDSAKTSCERLRQLKRTLKLPLKPHPHLLRRERAIKTSQEIGKLKESARLAYAGYQHLLKQLRSGIEEKALGSAFQLFCLKEGAEAMAFEPIIAFGKNSAFPHHRCGRDRLKKGQIVLFDLGVKLAGYVSDMTRIHFFGRPDPVLQKLYQVVRKAQRAALMLCKPGVEIGQLDRAARAVMKEEGVEELFLHNLGHGVGLEIHEFPFLKSTGADAHEILQAGMAITIEPGLYLSEKGGIRYEDTILVTKNGFLNLYPDEDL